MSRNLRRFFFHFFLIWCLRCLTSEIRRDPVVSPWYGRRQKCKLPQELVVTWEFLELATPNRLLNPWHSLGFPCDLGYPSHSTPTANSARVTFFPQIPVESLRPFNLKHWTPHSPHPHTPYR